MENNHKNNTVWILGLIVVLVLGVLIGNLLAGNKQKLQEASVLKSVISDSGQISQQSEQVDGIQYKKILKSAKKINSTESISNLSESLSDKNIPNGKIAGPQFYVSKPKLTKVDASIGKTVYTITYNVFSGSNDLYFSPFPYRTFTPGSVSFSLLQRTENSQYKQYFMRENIDSFVIGYNYSQNIKQGPQPGSLLLPANKTGSVTVEYYYADQNNYASFINSFFPGNYKFIPDGVFVFDDVTLLTWHPEQLQNVPIRNQFLDLRNGMSPLNFLDADKEFYTIIMSSLNNNRLYGIGLSKGQQIQITNDFDQCFSNLKFAPVVKNEGPVQTFEFGNNVSAGIGSTCTIIFDILDSTGNATIYKNAELRFTIQQ